MFPIIFYTHCSTISLNFYTLSVFCFPLHCLTLFYTQQRLKFSTVSYIHIPAHCPTLFRLSTLIQSSVFVFLHTHTPLHNSTPKLLRSPHPLPVFCIILYRSSRIHSTPLLPLPSSSAVSISTSPFNVLNINA